MVLDVIGHLTEPVKVMNQICMSLKKNGILRITFDNSNYSWAHSIHRNKEIDFYKIFKENRLIKIYSTHYKKI